MLPITVDVRRVRVLLVGDGEAACRRLERLDEAGAASLEVYAADPIRSVTYGGLDGFILRPVGGTIAEAVTVADLLGATSLTVPVTP